MTLIDAGPLIALIDKGQKHHASCEAALDRVTKPFLTTWPTWAEAMFLLGRIAGWPGQNALWQYLLRDEVTVIAPTPEQTRRTIHLMEQYRETPMDLADASLVALAEARNIHRIFTLDRHFYVYRLHGKQTFEVIP